MLCVYVRGGGGVGEGGGAFFFKFQNELVILSGFINQCKCKSLPKFCKSSRAVSG